MAAHRIDCGFCREIIRLRAGDAKKSEFVRAISKFDLFADKVAVEMLQQLVSLARDRVEQQDVSFEMRDPDMRDDASLVRGQERFAGFAEGQVLDVLRA